MKFTAVFEANLQEAVELVLEANRGMILFDT